MIVFTIIAVLAHREKIQKKRDGQLNPASASSDFFTSRVGDGDEKVAIVDEEDVIPVHNH